MLTKVKTDRNDKTIAITMTTAGTIYYTVPDGRKFIGYFTSRTDNANLRINGKDCLALSSTATTPYSPPQITLLAGDTVASLSATCSLLGIESDA